MRLLSISSLAVAFAVELCAAPVLTLIPADGIVSGAAGSSVGWGFTLTNTSDFLLVTGSSFTPVSPLGTFEDYISSFNFIVVGPAPESASVTQLFDVGTHAGIGAFHIIAAAPPVSIPGTITVNYALFSRSPNDPNFDPDTDTIIADATLSQTATVNVVPGSDTSVPEPGSFGLVLIAAAFGSRRLLRSC